MTIGQSWNAGLYDDRHAFVWRHGASLVEMLAPQRGERILDLGCGTGHLTAQIAAAGADVIGIDSSAAMIAAARSAYPTLRFEQVDAREFSFAEPLDAVFSNAVLHWIRPPEAVARCVARALRPGGRFIAEFGGHGNVTTVLTALRQALAEFGVGCDPIPDFYNPAIGEYASLLADAGLETTTALLFDRPTPLEGPEGLRNWLTMFTREAVESVSEERREDFFARVEDLTRPRLFRDGGWFADYRRLRLAAVRT